MTPYLLHCLYVCLFVCINGVKAIKYYLGNHQKNTCTNVDESCNMKEARLKRLFAYIYMTFWKKQDYIGVEQIGAPELRGGECLTMKGQHEGALYGVGVVLYAVCGGYKKSIYTCYSS